MTKIPALPIDNPAIASPLPRLLFLVVADNPAILNPTPTGNKAKLKKGRKNKLTKPTADDIKPHLANLSTLSAFSSFIFLTFLKPLVFQFHLCDRHLKFYH